MIRFECDYLEGAHPRIMERLMETNLEQTPGYGEDPYCEAARKMILELCGCEGARVHFLVGGTQTNTTVIASVLRPHQGVISADTGHITIHETGAIESTGHKVLPVDSQDGTLTAEQIQAVYDDHWEDPDHEHIVQPGMVYLSHPTENGTLYTKDQLTAISKTCRKLGLILFVDGARLGYGLAAAKLSGSNDGITTLAEMAELCDVFYIGGTKIGLLFGEAVVICNPAIRRDFRYMIKQRGGMLAKGRLLGVQFQAAFEDGLYFAMSEHAIKMALRIREAFEKKGVPFLYRSNTNQQFPILEDRLLLELEKNYSFCFWRKVDENHTAFRVCTSWATREEHVEALIRDIEGLDL